MTDLLHIAPSPIQGLGGFAKSAIPAGSRVIEYVGERITKGESARRCEAMNWFIFGLDDEFDLDGNVERNPARFLNHSCAPNCEAICEEGRIWIVALRDIRSGEEITFNYGYDLEDYQEHPCHCGAPECVNYIVAAELMPHLRKKASISAAGD
ncbi:MAG: SET domain-containing protein [Limisphaerales bacterium]